MASANVWIGNLPAAMTDDALVDLFSVFGTIKSSRVIRKARGTCGLVLFEDPEAAVFAIQEMNDKPYEDQQLIVQLTNPPREKSGVAAVAANNAAAAGPSTNIWLGNLPFRMKEDELHALMSAYGAVTSVKILKDKRTGKNEGAALVNFANPQDAVAAIAGIEGQIIPNSPKPVVAKMAASKEARGVAAAKVVSPQAVPIGRLVGRTNVWVGNLPAEYQEADIAALFQPYGEVTSCKVLLGKSSGRPEGAALVNFSSPAGASNAIRSVNGFALSEGGKPLIVRPSANREAVVPGAAPAPVQYASRPTRAVVGSSIPTNLWVGNLPVGSSVGDLTALFSPYGQVLSAKVLADRQGRPTAEQAGMVNYGSPEEAARAIQALSGKMLPGCAMPLIVKYSSKDFGTAGAPVRSAVPLRTPIQARPMAPLRTLPATQVLASPRSGVPAVACDNLWVGNLPNDYGEAEVASVFGAYGNVISCVTMPPKQAGQWTGALVKFGTVSEATGALSALNGATLDPAVPPMIVKYSSRSSARPITRGAPRPAYHPYAAAPRRFR